MITQQHRQDGLGRAYVQAVAAKAGFNLSLSGRTYDYKIDGTFHQVRKVKGKMEEAGISLDFQLKSSYDVRIEDDYVVYNLEVDNYNHLVRRTRESNGTCAILILFCLHEDQEEWVRVSPDQLVLKRCCYWHQLSGEESDNTRTQVVSIPKSQLLTDTALINIFEKLSRRELALC